MNKSRNRSVVLNRVVPQFLVKHLSVSFHFRSTTTRQRQKK